MISSSMFTENREYFEMSVFFHLCDKCNLLLGPRSWEANHKQITIDLTHPRNFRQLQMAVASLQFPACEDKSLMSVVRGRVGFEI